MPSVTFVLLDRFGRVLMECRPEPDSPFPEELYLFPGGKIEPGETVGAALLRETREELGIELTAYESLLDHQEVHYRGHPDRPEYRLYPFLVPLWAGTVPGLALDTGRLLEWRRLAQAVNSPVDCTRRIARAVAHNHWTRGRLEPNAYHALLELCARD